MACHITNLYLHLHLKIVLANQRRNVSCVIGTVSHSKGMEDIFDFVSNKKVDQDDENLSCKICGNLYLRVKHCL